MARGNQCVNCDAQTMHEENGMLKCSRCKAVAWGPLDPPRASGRGKGFKCFVCANATLHDCGPVATVTVYRCSTCGATELVPKHA